MSGNSNVGNRQVYEAGDQRNPKVSEMGSGTRYQEGTANSHLQNDPKDQRSLSNRAAAESSTQQDSESVETSLHKTDPTLPAKTHGNEPSRGAQIDAEIQAEEEEIMKKKGQNLPGKKITHHLMISDAEILCIITKVLEAFRADIVIKLNHRKIFDGLFEMAEAMKAIDKVSYDLVLAKSLDYQLPFIYWAVPGLANQSTQVGNAAVGGRYDNFDQIFTLLRARREESTSGLGRQADVYLMTLGNKEPDGAPGRVHARGSPVVDR
ncbi:Histidine--tRNA ligase, cytoplasmic [Madurella mycetomatis]|uniref:Histidine--tRNA ligase, cytoplasmic n=1 Tax=Madurella mycetomatis TaxID=100816 RepID=A0A175W666_9PEZI|nr:Histidine--tRNA ligase, cytoplasmic [Madurella mycetomatis]